LKVTILGQAQVQKNLNNYINIMARNTTQALEEIGQRGVGIVKNNTPVDTGRLRQSMDYKTEKDFVEVGTNVIYAQSVEFRSKQNKGFFLRSFNQLVPIAKEIFRKAMEVKK
jgi:hypothetical protein